MNVGIICDTANREVIEHYLRKTIDLENVYFEEYETEDMRSHCEILMVEHVLVPKMKNCKAVNYEKILIIYNKQIFASDRLDEYIEQRRQAIDEKKYQIAKFINEIIIDFDFIFKNVVNNGMPDYLQIETTSVCNAKCIMCSHYFSNNKNAKHLSMDTLKNMVDALQVSKTISLNGMGEPFVSPNVSEQIDYYAKFGNKIVTNTNLSLVSEGILKQIDSHFEWLEISCDGATRETYEAIRKNLKFDILLENLGILKKQCPNVRKHVATVVMRQNVKEMPMLVELAHKYGAHIITFMTLNSNIIIENSEDEMCNYPLVLEYYSMKALEMGEKLGIPVIVPNAHAINRNIKLDDIEVQLKEMENIPMYKSREQEAKMDMRADAVSEYLEFHDEIQRDTKASNVKCSGICDWILKQSYIDLQGNVAMCCRNQSFHIGNVNDTKTFGGIWNADFYAKLRKIFYSGYLPEACLKCGLIESGNLRFLNVEVNDDFYQEPEYKSKQIETLSKIVQGKSIR